MGKQGGESKWFDHSASSTVLWDPAAFVIWKQQIQGKDGIPTKHQRLTFACPGASPEVAPDTCKPSSSCPRAEEHAASEFLKELRSWEAILKDKENHAIAKLLHPSVAAEEQVAEDERVASLPSCQTARELRSMGFPCNVYYLFFDQWIPTSLKDGKCCKEMSSINIQIDNDFKSRTYQILLFGRLNGNNFPRPFTYRMNGENVAAQVSIQKQTAEYRLRHRLGRSSQCPGNGIEGRDVQAVVENGGPNNHDKNKHVDDFYCPCGKVQDLEFTVIISNYLQLKCFVLTVIQFPNAPTKLEQLAAHVPDMCERGRAGSRHESNVYQVASPCKCEGFEVSTQSEDFETKLHDQNLEGEQISSKLAEKIAESFAGSGEPMGKNAKKRKKKKGKRNGKLGEIGKSTASQVDNSLLSGSTPLASRVGGSPSMPVEVGFDREMDDTGSNSTCASVESVTPSIRELPLVDEGIEKSSEIDSSCKKDVGRILYHEGERLMVSMKEDCCKLRTPELNSKEVCTAVSTDSSNFGMISDRKADQSVKYSNKDCSKEDICSCSIRRDGKKCLRQGKVIQCSGCPSTSSSEGSADFRDPSALRANPNLTYLSTSTNCSHNLGMFQPYIGPILVNPVIEDPLTPARSSVDAEVSHLPFRELAENSDNCSDARDKIKSSDSHVSARGGHHGNSAGNRNGRSGADGSGSRNGKGPEDRKGTGGYNGSGQGSSSSNHGSGPGGSSTSGSSGGSGGGNGNRGGGRGSSGGGRDGRRGGDDGGNSSKEGDNDERHRNSFQVGSNGEAASESLQRKKGIPVVDNGSGHSRKGPAGDHLVNGSHGSLATNSGTGKENLSSHWQKVQRPLDDDGLLDTDELTDRSGSTNFAGVDEGSSFKSANAKLSQSTGYSNGYARDTPNADHCSDIEKEKSEDHRPTGKDAMMPVSFLNVLKQSLSDSGQDSQNMSSLNAKVSKESQGTVLLPHGAWQKKIPWDHAPDGNIHAGLSKGSLHVKFRNGTHVKTQVSDTENITHPKSLSAPSTPNGFQEGVLAAREFRYSHLMRNSEGRTHPSRYAGDVKIPAEANQKFTAWKSRKGFAEQEKYLGKDKVTGDRDRTTQKWVPVEDKNGGPTKVPSTKLSINEPAGFNDKIYLQIKDSEQGLEFEQTMGSSGVDSSVNEILCRPGLAKSLRRLQTFPSGNSAAISRIVDSDPEVLIERSVSVVNERAHALVEQANLRSLLPKERAIGTPSIHPSPQSRNYLHEDAGISEQMGSSNSEDVRPNKEAVAQKGLSPGEEEMHRAARAVLDAVHLSCKERWAAEGTVRMVGCDLAEFEKVLRAVTPSFLPVAHPSTSPMHENSRDGVCKCGQRVSIYRENSSSSGHSEECTSTWRRRAADSPLSSIWNWYEEPSYYGLEVRAVDSQRVLKNGGAEEPFLAYYVPYLSGLQLFGNSSESNVRCLKGLGGAKETTDTSVGSLCQPKFSGTDVLATLFPTPGKADEFFPRSARHGVCNAKDTGFQLLYEFYESDVPQVRQPLFPKVEELSRGVSSLNSHSSGDPAVLDKLCLGDIHPASWFAVAWYPIYRISDGPLRAVFLTYHSFSDLASSGSLFYPSNRTGDIDSEVSLPVVGMECYNLQAEPWLSISGQFTREASKVSEKLEVNPLRQLENRISSLHNVAALMAKGIPDFKLSSSGSGRSGKFKHSDYEFFVKRRR